MRWGCGVFARVGRIGSPPGYTNALPPKGAMGEAPRGAPARVRMVPIGSTVALPLRGAQHATLARRGHKSAPFGRIYLKLRGSSMKMISADKFAAWTRGPWQSPVEHLKAQDRAPASIESIGASTGQGALGTKCRGVRATPRGLGGGKSGLPCAHRVAMTPGVRW